MTRKKDGLLRTKSGPTGIGFGGERWKIFDKSQDKYRQINKYIEIVDHLIRDFPNRQNDYNSRYG
ncbi:MAG: hypothetical protein IPJ13_01605 [Saprospiraceae bacterium]|nr:hypothetical protein [Saprospiraceae bacterium]